MSWTTDRLGRGDGSPRTVVVNDSPFRRWVIADLLTDAGVAVVGETGDREELLDLDPDLGAGTDAIVGGEA